MFDPELQPDAHNLYKASERVTDVIISIVLTSGSLESRAIDLQNALYDYARATNGHFPEREK